MAGKSARSTGRPPLARASQFPFPVVGVGTSAGRPEDCAALLKALPRGTGTAMVVVQHLDPYRPSRLLELLAASTGMPIARVEDGMRLEPDRVYVIPLGQDATLRRGALRLSSRRQTAGRHMPVDRFFQSLAGERKGAAIGVVLSGTGPDGAAGLQAIKSAGGIACALEPGSARYCGLADSAIAAGCVNFVLPLEPLAQELGRLLRLPDGPRPKGAANRDELTSLHHELCSTREQLRSITESQEATSEELEATREELESSNEELTTLNEELQSRNAELGQLADDLSTLLVGIDIPVVILGPDRRIRRFTPAAERLMNLIPGDIGRPIGDIQQNVDVPEMDQLISDAIEHAEFVERNVQTRDGRWYSLRMRPYRSASGGADGVLIALMDIDAMKRSYDQAKRSRDEAVAERDLSATLLDLSGALIVVRDAHGAVSGFNSACQKASGYSFHEVKNKPLWELLLRGDESGQAKAAFAALRGGSEAVTNDESCWIARDGSRRVIAWSNLAHRAPDGSLRRVISTGVDITERKLAEDALRQSQEDLRRLTANLLTTQEEERRRLARELHDDVNQRMAMLANEVNLLERDLPGSAGLVRGQLRSLRERTEQLSDDLRRAAQQLHPSVLEHFGLVAALEAYCPDFSKLHTIRLRFAHRGVPDTVSPELSLCLYRVAQECLRNVAKHSGAKEAAMELRGNRSSLILSVRDNGIGFDQSAAGDRRGLGLVGIQERVRLVGGALSIDSRPGGGTEVRVRVPLSRTAL